MERRKGVKYMKKFIVYLCIINCQVVYARHNQHITVLLQCTAFLHASKLGQVAKEMSACTNPIEQIHHDLQRGGKKNITHQCRPGLSPTVLSTKFVFVWVHIVLHACSTALWDCGSHSHTQYWAAGPLSDFAEHGLASSYMCPACASAAHTPKHATFIRRIPHCHQTTPCMLLTCHCTSTKSPAAIVTICDKCNCY